ncbi:TetR/AcrR family transcriptional regulator [Streptomyces sp. NBC_01353]|uniref:TetR/AcrR family transcriptional regulator n=1 Tax=Streptomyces sp. NBC_01353 TaxID=2903835 RepID=UPI002E31E305|nr:helix-turn-helix domain-containing protein [Streptomyces sp. NBC_01353]
MARPRMFDEARALDAAMHLFWEKGYEATSTQDLCEATGLGRSSIYNTFASKHALFLRALARYTEMTTSSQLALLEDETLSPVDRLKGVMASIVEMEETHRRAGIGIGCLVVNSTVELSGRDPQAAALLGRDQERRLAALAATIAAGQSAGVFSRDRRADELARFFTAAVAGMRVSAQNGADRAVIESIAAIALDALTA